MLSIFNALEKVRDSSPILLDDISSNRYAIHCQESNGAKTAYCFSVPIRNIKTKGIIDLRFYHTKQGSIFQGSEARITIAHHARLLNSYGRCDVVFQGNMTKKTDTAVFVKSNTHCIEICPTLNGLKFIFDCTIPSNLPNIKLRLDRIFETIRFNNKYFSVMREKFIPFITVSCIGVINAHGKVVAPCEIHNQKINNFEYNLTFRPLNNARGRIVIEINMQETKLFQDTTVESNHPTMNNAFGGVAFLGTSKSFGEQLLYSRLEISHIAQLQSKKIIKCILHIPVLGYNTAPVTANRISERFCSLGSNWENKIAITNKISDSSYSNGYFHIDMTKLLGNLREKSKNFVIQTNPISKPVIIPTGDSFCSPQILEVRYQ